MSATEKAVAENSPRTLSEIIERLFEIRTERKQIADRDSELVAEWNTLEEILLAKMQEQGSTRVSSKLGTVSISEQKLPIVEDWDAVEQYIKDNDALYLLQRRMAVGAYRELIDSGQEVPGTRPVTKKSINLRAGK